MEEKKETKVYDWKKSVVKKGEKKEIKAAEPEPKPEKIQLKKPKVIEKPKEEAKAGVQLKPTPPKQPKEAAKKEEIKLKPVPPKQKAQEVGNILHPVLNIFFSTSFFSIFIFFPGFKLKFPIEIVKRKINSF